MKTLFEPKSGLLSVPYQPDAESKSLENPPRFTWMPGQLENDRYMSQISTSPSYETEATMTIAPIPYNLYTPDHALEAGTYYWRYALLTGEQGEDAMDAALTVLHGANPECFMFRRASLRLPA